MFYARTRQLNPMTGDVVFDASRESYGLGHPTAELIARCVRTPVGSAQRDPTYGIDLTGLDTIRPNTPAVAATRIRAALARYVKLALFTIVAVRVEAQGDALIWEVDFRDPRDAKPLIRTASGTLPR